MGPAKSVPQTKIQVLDTTRAVGELPSLGLLVEKAAAKRTGTGDVPVQVPDDSLALNRGSECPGGSTSGHFGNTECGENAVFAGASGEDGVKS
jgi:hypothetical protein